VAAHPSVDALTDHELARGEHQVHFQTPHAKDVTQLRTARFWEPGGIAQAEQIYDYVLDELLGASLGEDPEGV
jgi:hypothetical protein